MTETGVIGLTMMITMPITITSKIMFYSVYLDDSALLQCRIGLISKVIVISIVNPMPLFQSLCHNPISSHFFQKVFVPVLHYRRIAQSSIVHNSPAINVNQMHAHQPSIIIALQRSKTENLYT